MARSFTYIEGQTVPIQRTLKKGPRGAAAAFNASGMAIALELWDRSNNEVVVVGTVDWADPLVSLAQFDPAVDDLLFSRGKLYARWKVTDQSGDIAYFPGGAEPEEWVIGRAHGTSA